MGHKQSITYHTFECDTCGNIFESRENNNGVAGPMEEEHPREWIRISGSFNIHNPNTNLQPKKRLTIISITSDKTFCSKVCAKKYLIKIIEEKLGD